VPGEAGPREHRSQDPVDRSIVSFPCGEEPSEFKTVGEIFDDATNPGRKKPFPMRAVMAALVDQDGGHLERWRQWVGAETAIVWDAHVGGMPALLIGIESRNVPREGYRPGTARPRGRAARCSRSRPRRWRARSTQPAATGRR
jgi:hypothetical protein